MPFAEGNPGRPPGARGKLSGAAQRAFAESVLGKPGSPEMEAFVKSLRDQVMSGPHGPLNPLGCPPAVLITLLHYLKGKPIEHVEVTVDVQERRFEGTPRQQLEARARLLLDAIHEMDEPDPIEVAVSVEDVT